MVMTATPSLPTSMVTSSFDMPANELGFSSGIKDNDDGGGDDDDEDEEEEEESKATQSECELDRECNNPLFMRTCVGPYLCAITCSTATESGTEMFHKRCRFDRVEISRSLLSNCV